MGQGRFANFCIQTVATHITREETMIPITDTTHVVHATIAAFGGVIVELGKTE